MLKSSRNLSLSAGNLLKQIEYADPLIEARLTTMLQSVRGTKQYWYMRKSELQLHDQVCVFMVSLFIVLSFRIQNIVLRLIMKAIGKIVCFVCV